MFTTIATLALTSLLPQQQDGNWPGWRGPGGNATATGSPPIEWAEDINVRWKTELAGRGYSSPIVWGDKVIVTSAVAIGEPVEPKNEGDSGFGARGQRPAPPVEHDFLVMAFSKESGELLWESIANTLTPHQGRHPDGSYATPTPVTDGEILVASFGSFGLFGFDLEGELLWKKDLGDMDITNEFGEGASPVLSGEFLIHPWDHNGDSFLIALDKRTGEEKWRVARTNATTWCSPLVVESDKGPQVVMATARTISYDVATGKQRWAYGELPDASAGRPSERGGREEGDRSAGGQQMMQQGGGQRGGRSGGERGGGSGIMSSPIVHDGVLLMSSGSRRGSFQAFDITKASGELTRESDALLWVSEGDTPFVPSPIAYDGVLYSLKSNSGLLSAIDVKTGERIYGPERLDALATAYASPVAAGGHLYFAGRDGTFEVIKTGAEFETVAVNMLDDNFDASPAIAGDQIYLRGLHFLYCIAEEE